MGEPLIRSVFSCPKLVLFHYSPDNGMVQEVATWETSIALRVISAREFVLAVVQLNPKFIVRIQSCPWYQFGSMNLGWVRKHWSVPLTEIWLYSMITLKAVTFI